LADCILSARSSGRERFCLPLGCVVYVLLLQVVQLAPPRVVATSLHSKTQSEFVTIAADPGTYTIVLQGSIPGALA
jgi:hypothetical protein